MTLRPGLLLLLLPGILFAQPSATMRRALLEAVDLEFSYSSQKPVAQGATVYGQVSVLTTSLSVSGRHRLAAATFLAYGLAYQQHRLDTSTALLPDRLAELTLNLGLLHQFSPTWSSAIFARPGFYSDFDELTGSSLNLPVLAMFNYTPKAELTWNFGVNVDPSGKNPVRPIAGVRWQFAPDWTFSIGFPQSGFKWSPAESLTVRAGASFIGGNYRITTNRGIPKAGVARLANTYLDFHEVRVGLGADLILPGGFTLTADLGAVTDRKFDYFDRDFRLDGDAGFYGTLGLKAAF
jgi:hypothetical protein